MMDSRETLKRIEEQSAFYLIENDFKELLTNTIKIFPALQQPLLAIINDSGNYRLSDNNDYLSLNNLLKLIPYRQQLYKALGLMKEEVKLQLLKKINLVNFDVKLDALSGLFWHFSAKDKVIIEVLSDAAISLPEMKDRQNAMHSIVKWFSVNNKDELPDIIDLFLTIAESKPEGIEREAIFWIIIKLLLDHPDLELTKPHFEKLKPYKMDLFEAMKGHFANKEKEIKEAMKGQLAEKEKEKMKDQLADIEKEILKIMKVIIEKYATHALAKAFHYGHKRWSQSTSRLSKIENEYTERLTKYQLGVIGHRIQISSDDYLDATVEYDKFIIEAYLDKHAKNNNSAALNVTRSSTGSALTGAIISARPEEKIIKLLTKLLAIPLVDVNQQTPSHDTALICAVKNKKLGIVKWLLMSTSIDLQAASQYERALEIAMNKQDNNAVDELLGAYTALKTNENKKVAMRAIMKMLLKFKEYPLTEKQLNLMKPHKGDMYEVMLEETDDLIANMLNEIFEQKNSAISKAIHHGHTANHKGRLSLYYNQYTKRSAEESEKQTVQVPATPMLSALSTPPASPAPPPTPTPATTNKSMMNTQRVKQSPQRELVNEMMSAQRKQKGEGSLLQEGSIFKSKKKRPKNDISSIKKKVSFNTPKKGVYLE